MINVYPDGACKGNPGIGGYAAVIVFENTDDNIKIIAGGDPRSTNNRMEITAVLAALSWIYENCREEKVTVHSDSQYIVKAINDQWLEKWIDKDFKNIKNKDLWLKLYKYVCKLNVTFTWVKGHNGNSFNELADKIASDATYYQGIPVDYKTVSKITNK